MNRRDFLRRVSERLREDGARKPISIPKQTFHISDDEGNTRDFSIKQVDKNALYTINDVTTIVDTCIRVIEECMRKGEAVTFHGFGTLGLRYRKPRKTKIVNTDTEIDVAGRYVPKFTFGNNLRMCARAYEESLEDESVGDYIYTQIDDGAVNDAWQ